VDALWVTKSEDVGLIAHAVNFQDSQTERQRDRQAQTDRRHAIARLSFAL